MPGIGSKLVANQLDNEQGSSLLRTTPRRSGGIKGCHARARGQQRCGASHKRDRARSQLNIGCGHDGRSGGVGEEPQGEAGAVRTSARYLSAL